MDAQGAAQYSAEWFEARCGRVTASRVADVVAKTKTGWGAARANYMAELIVERLTGEMAEHYVSPAMRWGLDMEPEARAAYEFYRDVAVRPVGFVRHPAITLSGASPDGLVGDDGLVEFKCPNTKTHLATLLGAEIDGAYLDQMQWQMACTGRQWTDFNSYDPRLPEEMRLHVERVPRDNERITELEKMVGAFLVELDAKVAALRERYSQEPETLPVDPGEIGPQSSHEPQKTAPHDLGDPLPVRPAESAGPVPEFMKAGKRRELEQADAS